MINLLNQLCVYTMTNIEHAFQRFEETLLQRRHARSAKEIRLYKIVIVVSSV